MNLPPPPTPDKILSALGSLLFIIVLIARLAGVSSTDPHNGTDNTTTKDDKTSALSVALSSSSKDTKNKGQDSNSEDADSRRNASSSSGLTTTSPAPTTEAQATEEETTYTYYAPTTTSQPVYTYEPTTPEPTVTKPQPEGYNGDLDFRSNKAWDDAYMNARHTPVGVNYWLKRKALRSDIPHILVVNGKIKNGVKLRGFEDSRISYVTTSVYDSTILHSSYGYVQPSFHFEGLPAINFEGDVKAVDFGLAFYHNRNDKNPTKHWSHIAMSVDVKQDSQKYSWTLDAPDNPEEDFYLPMAFKLTSGRSLDNISINFECYDNNYKRMACPAFGIADPHGWR